jgi:uncharacterized protein
MKVSNYILSTDVLDDAGIEGKRIIFSTRTAVSILVEEEMYQLMKNSKFESLPSDFLDTLVAKEFIVPQDQDEFEYILTANQSNKDDSTFLSMTIQPSANCQLGCHYCGQTHSKHYASDSVIDKYVERIEYLLTTREYTGLSITWYGGEPLTGLTSIKKASQKLLKLCEERSLTYMADMITNGLSLKTSVFEELVNDCKVTSYQITVDGTAEGHDNRRITKSGEPTFDIITRNIIDVVNTETYVTKNCSICIRINIDRTNYQYVEPLLDFIKDNEIQDKVYVHFAPITDFGGNDAGKESLEKKFFAEKEIEWMMKCYENKIGVKMMPSRVYQVCMVENKNSEVFDAFGNIYSCWEFPYSEKYAQGDSLIGNLFFPKETYNENATLRDWNSVLQSGTTWCKTCAHLPICGGSCPKSWYEGTPACPPFKSNYKDRLLLDFYVKRSKRHSESELLNVAL